MRKDIELRQSSLSVNKVITNFVRGNWVEKDFL